MVFIHFLRLPNELILLIAEALSRPTLNSLQQTNHRLHSLLLPLLHSSTDPDQDSLLSWAALNGRPNLTTVLLNRGANPTTTQYPGFGLRPLDLAILANHEPVVRVLLANGADPNTPTRIGWTPLSWAAVRGDEAVVQLLLENGADIAHKDHLLRTALHWAAICANEKVFVRLVENGADVEARDGYGAAVLHWVLYSWDALGKRFILGRGVGHVDEAEVAMVVGFFGGLRGEERLEVQRRMIDLLMARGVEIRLEDWRMKRVLHTAARKRMKSFVEMLVEKGASAEERSYPGGYRCCGTAKSSQRCWVERLLQEAAEGSQVGGQASRGSLPLREGGGHGRRFKALLGFFCCMRR